MQILRKLPPPMANIYLPPWLAPLEVEIFFERFLASIAAQV